MEYNIHIEDDSGDKSYFTIIPNYILNHSTANDQALYLQMKRYAGEKGECFASESRLCKQLGIGRKALKKSLEYLLSHNWISHKGVKPVMTKGGSQAVNVYVINDIWKMNSEYYKGVAERQPLEDKGVLQRTGGAQKEAKGVLQRATNKNHSEEDPIEEDISKQSLRDSKFNPLGAELIKLFEEVNPACKRYYGNTTQRQACDDLITTYGFDEVSRVIPVLVKTNKMLYFPNIQTPKQLWEKYQTLKDKFHQKKIELETKNKVAF